MNEWIEKYERYLTLLNKSERTIINYTKTLKKIIKDEKIEDIEEFVDMDRSYWFSWIEEQRETGKNSIATINCKIKQMSSWYHFLVNEGIVSNNPLYKFPHINELTSHSEYKGDKAMSVEEAKAILEAIETEEFNHYTQYINLRNKCLVMILLSCGLRIDEVSKIQIQDIEFENNKLYVRGKGGKNSITRHTNFSPKLKTLIVELIKYNPNRTYLFTNIRYERLLTQGIRNVWYEALDIANVKHYTPHNCRHFLGSELSKKGVPMKQIADVLGHSSYKTSEKYYVKPKNQDMQDIISNIDIFE